MYDIRGPCLIMSYLAKHFKICHIFGIKNPLYLSSNRYLTIYHFRTDQLLEMFEDAPDDDANWGRSVATDEKFYNTDSSTNSSSDEVFQKIKKDAKDDKKSKKKKVRKSKEKESVRPTISRAQTAKALKNTHEVQRDVRDLRTGK